MRNPFGQRPDRDISALFDMMGISGQGQTDQCMPRPTNAADLLRNAYAVFAERHTFTPGDLVCWKPGQQNKGIPAYGEPVIVVTMLDTPLRNEADAGEVYFNEPLDLVLGTFHHQHGDVTFVTYHYDSRRFQPYREATDDTAE